MRKKKFQVVLVLAILLFTGCQTTNPNIVKYDNPITISGYTETTNLDNFTAIINERSTAIIEKYNPLFNRQVSVILFPSAEALHKAQGRETAPDWMVGSAMPNGEIWMVNPYCSSVHDYESMKKILVHEYTHVVVMSVNSRIPSWLNEGIACYEADQKIDQKTATYVKQQAEEEQLPNFWEIDKDRSTGDVYIYAGIIIEYILEQYSLESLNAFIRTPDILKIFDKSWQEFQDGWKKYIIEKY